MSVTSDSNTMSVTGTDGEIVEKDWSYVAFCTQWNKNLLTSTYSVSVNLNAAVTDSNGVMLNDEPTNGKLMGAENNVLIPGSFVKANYYTGMIWEFCVYATYLDTHDDFIAPPDTCDELNLCVTCPPSDECLIDCDWNEFRDAETLECLPCREDCLEGCQEAAHCNVCEDERCDSCFPAWKDCQACIENAEFRPEPECYCMDTYSYDNETNSCVQCHVACDSCEEIVNGNINNFSCLECAEGYFKIPGTTICMQNCPSGYEPDTEGKVCSGAPPAEISCVTFDRVD